MDVFYMVKRRTPSTVAIATDMYTRLSNYHGALRNTYWIKYCIETNILSRALDEVPPYSTQHTQQHSLP